MKISHSKKTQLRAKIFIGIFISFFLVKYFSPQIFIANTPQVNPNFVANILASPSTILAYIRSPFDPETRNNVIETAKMPKANPPPGLQYQPIANGVYAAEDPQTNLRYVKIDKGTKLEIRYITLDDGSTAKVYVSAQ